MLTRGTYTQEYYDYKHANIQDLEIKLTPKTKWDVKSFS